MNFPATRHSVVRDLASVDPDVRAAAYDGLVRSYWRPVYLYVRLKWRRSPEDAQDLTQEFFARAFEREYLERYDPARARFRTFVRTCLDGFLSNHDQAAARLKRGGGFVIAAVDFARADEELAARASDDQADPELWFHREWIRGLFGEAVDALRTHAETNGHPAAFALFRRYDLDDEGGDARPTYAALAREAGISVAAVTNELAWARRAFREIVLERLRRLCATDEEFRAEARDLLGVDPP